ncbi:MAG: RagB/SusD family nutrient uptake outer membrane protein [Flavitalea sp.]
MKKYIYSISVLALIGVITYSCSKSFLENTPKGVLDEAALANKRGVEALLIGAYSLLDGTQRGAVTIGGWESAGSNWVYGSVVGGDAHKGSDAGDQPAMNPIERFEHNATNPYFDIKWGVCYEGINRCNSTLRVMAKATDIGADDMKRIEGEAKFLRAHYYFELKRMFGKVPLVTETSESFNLPNDTDIWPNITADMKAAYDLLPVTTGAAKGRANKWAAAAYLGKIYLYQKDWTNAQDYLDEAYTVGVNAQGQKYKLLDKFQDNFNAETKNSTESVFAVQYSVNDGAVDAANGGWGEVLNFPYLSGASPGGCCGFFQPTQDLVNSFQVEPNGLPDIDNYNKNELKNDFGLEVGQPFTVATNPVDPRLDWTVGRRGIPFLDWGPMAGKSWVRDQVYSGPYAAIKNTYYKSQQGSLTDKSFWTSGVTANNYTIIRFADLILMLAEAEAQLNNVGRAFTLVNEVRNRAKNPVSRVPGSPATYLIEPYAGGFASKEDALKKIYFERKLELGMEGHRFFDLVRWGLAETEMNKYLKYVSGDDPAHPINNKRLYLRGSKFTPNKNEIFPIPQRQIDLSTVGGTPLLTQNPGY